MSPTRATSALLAARGRRGRGARRGLSLVEVMVVIAILVALAVVVVPAMSSFLQLEQRRVAKELALTYEVLQDQAVLRNVTFRIAYHLDEGFYQVEVGSPETLIFSDPDARERWERERASQLRRMTQRERDEKGVDDDPFQAVQAMFRTRVELPRGTRFGGVYTPQYGRMIEPSRDERDPRVVHAYIFPNGFTEHTVVHLVDEARPTEGFTIEVEPVSGRVHLDFELRRYDERMSFVPQRGPALP